MTLLFPVKDTSSFSELVGEEGGWVGGRLRGYPGTGDEVLGLPVRSTGKEGGGRRTLRVGVTTEET